MTCPLEAVARATPTVGRVLDVGCGHGVVATHLALEGPGREVVGVDIDVEKLEVARGAARGVPGLRFEACGDALPPGRWDAVLLVDVLYLLPRGAQRAMLDRCVDALAPGGVLIVKCIARRPRWKLALTVAQELVATRVARITQGSAVEFVSPDETAAWMRERLTEVRARRIDAGLPHPHALVVGHALAEGRERRRASSRG
ncbi:MAG: class I SAM-dependent methyltransferase [Polyangiales bacterium]